MKCLRCGKEMKTKGSFCADCNATTVVPLEDSPYLQKQIVLPQRKPVQKPKKPEVKKQRKPETKPRRLFCILLCLICITLLLQLGYVLREQQKYRAEIARLQSVEDECVLLTDKLRQAEVRILELEELLTVESAP